VEEPEQKTPAKVEPEERKMSVLDAIRAGAAAKPRRQTARERKREDLALKAASENIGDIIRLVGFTVGIVAAIILAVNGLSAAAVAAASASGVAWATKFAKKCD
jgi:hypothetical protein